MDSNNVTEKSPGANTGEQQAKAVSYQPPQRPKHLSIDPKAEASGENDPAAKAIERGARRIRIMRIIQSTFGAALSVAIAGFQGRVFALFQSSKSVTGAWPDNPNLMPTLLLLAVASLALIFDLSMLLAYLKPNHRMARVAFTVATASHYIITSAKTVSYAIGAIVARTSYNYGNSSGQTADLWSWSCTDQAAAMQNVNQAPSNCDTQVSPRFNLCCLSPDANPARLVT